MCYPTSVSAAGNNNDVAPKKTKANSQSSNRLPISPASTSVSAANAAAVASSSAALSLSYSSSSSSTTRTSTAAAADSAATSVSPSRTNSNYRFNNSSPPRRENNHSPILKVLFSALFVDAAVSSFSFSSSSQVSNLKKKHRHLRQESRDDYFDGEDEGCSPSAVILPQPRVLIYQKEEGGATDEEEEELYQQQQEEEQQRIQRQMQQTLSVPSLDHQHGQQHRERVRCLLSATTAAATPSSISAAVAAAVVAPVTSTTTKKMQVQVRQQETVEAEQQQQQQQPFFFLEVDEYEVKEKLWRQQRRQQLAQGWNQKGLSLASKATQAEAEQAHGQADEESLEGDTRESNHEQEHQQENENIYALWSHALHCWNDSLQLYSSLLGNDSFQVADVQNNRGVALGKLKQYKYAFQAFQQAITIHKQRLLRLQEIKLQHHNTEKQRLLRSIKHKNNKKASSTSEANTDEGIIVCALISTLHNISNVYRDAGEPFEAIHVLLEAQDLLEDSIVGPLEQQTIMNTTITNDDDTMYSKYFKYYQLLARLFTAMGHIYYYDVSGNACDESESLHESINYYKNALEVYETLLMKWTTRHSTTLDNNNNQNEEEEEQQQQQQNQHRELIQHEIHLLQQDIIELNLCCQEGSSRKLSVQGKQKGKGKQQQQQQQQQLTKKNSSSFFNFVRNLCSP